jgi:hypothetical protein
VSFITVLSEKKLGLLISFVSSASNYKNIIYFQNTGKHYIINDNKIGYVYFKFIKVVSVSSHILHIQLEIFLQFYYLRLFLGQNFFRP